MGEKLIQAVNVFTCCIFTPRVLTTVVPAFLLAGAIAAFLPRQAVLHYLGPRARRWSAYSVSALSGVLLSLCSCNVVPLFVSIYRSGAGLGPAFTFLYAGPAINVVSLIFVFQVIGWRLGLWRALGVPVIAIVVGSVAALLYAREERARSEALLQAHAETQAEAQTNGGQPETVFPGMRSSLAIIGMMLLFVILGSIHMPWQLQAPLLSLIMLLAVFVAYRFKGTDDLLQWGRETWDLVKLIVPVFIPVVLAIGLFATLIDIKWVYRLVGDNSLRSIFSASVFGSLMYFPILTEVAFTKAFLKEGMATGPALAILLTGAGLSLPGAAILTRVIGLRKVLVYIGLVILLATITSLVFSWQVGQYMCPCTMGLK